MPTKKFDWSEEISALPSDEFRLTMPVYAMLTEATKVAEYFRDHYKGDKKKDVPGFADAGIPASTGDEIDSLVKEASAAFSAYNQAANPKTGATKIERARFIVDEVQAVLEYYLDDGVEDEDDKRLANVVASHKDVPETAAALSLELEDWASFAELHRDGIKGLGLFDVSLLDEAATLGAELRADAAHADPTPALTQAALATRNRYLQLLDARVRLVRTTARFAFRHHPAIAQKAVSTYDRARRIQAKRSATRRKNESATPTNGGAKPDPITPNA